ncbi:pfkB-like carbohydrate kinase family protein [Perilla frutescens var. frutescens]|nr:pfkB-like carbohydrate kinase family protein [Perilla frutescens var. frutescens]
MIENRGPASCLVVGNYCHDVLMKDGVVLAESLGGAAAFISAVLDGAALPSTFVSKVGPDFAYAVTRSPFVSLSSKTTVFHAHFSSQVQRHDRVLKRVRSCEPITPLDLPDSRRFEFGLAVGVAGEILPETLEKMLDICDTVFVDVQALIRAFDPIDGTVSLVHLRDSGFGHLIGRIGFLKASSDEAPYVGVEAVRKECCVVVTNGEDGCTVYNRNVEHQIAPFPTVQVDPTGAGDSFLGGLVVGLVEGMTVPDAALLGNFFGSLTVGQLGLPKFDLRVLQAVKDELQRRRLKLLSHEKPNDRLVFVKPVDHEDFRMTLVRARNLPTLPVRECQQELASSPRVVENHISFNGQPRLISSNACEEPIMSGDLIP